MPIEGLEYDTNQWDGLGRGRGRARPPAKPVSPPRTTPVAAKDEATVVVNAPKPVAAQAKPDPFVSTITGILDKFKALFGWK